MTTAHSVDYRNNFFEITNLTRVHGEPSFESLRTLQRELLINAQCVHSDLGGGAHGHLGLVLSPQEYALHSNAAYRRPQHPGPLVIAPGTTLHMANTFRDQHRERIRVFREVQGVEQALRQQLVTAKEPQYLEAFRDTATGRISLPVYDLLRQLYQLYGRVTPQKLQDQEDKIRQMTYDPTNPIDGIFTAIDDLVHYADAANSPYTQPQIVNMGYIILNRTGIFRRWILDWNTKPSIQQTWTNFKIHFRTAHQQLRETTTLQQHQTPFHANAVHDFLHELKTELRNEMLTTQYVSDTPPAASSVSTMSSDASQTISALQSELSSLKEMMQHLTQAPPPPPAPPQQPPWLYPPHQYSPYPPMYAQQMTPPPQPPSQRSNKRTYYCWTHGLCFHSSNRCKKRAPGHQPTATLNNQMGGSVKNIKLPAQVPQSQSSN